GGGAAELPRARDAARPGAAQHLPLDRARLFERPPGAADDEPRARTRLRPRGAGCVAAVLLPAARTQRGAGGPAAWARPAALAAAGSGPAGRRTHDPPASRDHRAFRPLPAPQRHPRPRVDRRRTGVPRRMRAPFRAAHASIMILTLFVGSSMSISVLVES